MNQIPWEVSLDVLYAPCTLEGVYAYRAAQEMVRKAATGTLDSPVLPTYQVFPVVKKIRPARKQIQPRSRRWYVRPEFAHLTFEELLAKAREAAALESQSGN